VIEVDVNVLQRGCEGGEQILGQRIEEQAAHQVHMPGRGVGDRLPPLRGQHDVGRAAVLGAGAAVGETAFFHAPQLM